MKCLSDSGKVLPRYGERWSFLWPVLANLFNQVGILGLTNVEARRHERSAFSWVFFFFFSCANTDDSLNCLAVKKNIFSFLLLILA